MGPGWREWAVAEGRWGTWLEGGGVRRDRTMSDTARQVAGEEGVDGMSMVRKGE